MIEPVNPFQGCVFHRIQIPPGAATVNHFGFIESDDRLRKRVVVGISDTAYRRLRASPCQPLRVADR